MENTEKRLRLMFDFQRFTGNQRLDDVIRATGPPGGPVPLHDDQLELNAAGEPEAWRGRQDGGEKP